MIKLHLTLESFLNSSEYSKLNEDDAHHWKTMVDKNGVTRQVREKDDEQHSVLKAVKGKLPIDPNIGSNKLSYQDQAEDNSKISISDQNKDKIREAFQLVKQLPKLIIFDKFRANTIIKDKNGNNIDVYRPEWDEFLKFKSEKNSVYALYELIEKFRLILSAKEYYLENQIKYKDSPTDDPNKIKFYVANKYLPIFNKIETLWNEILPEVNKLKDKIDKIKQKSIDLGKAKDTELGIVEVEPDKSTRVVTYTVPTQMTPGMSLRVLRSMKRLSQQK